MSGEQPKNQPTVKISDVMVMGITKDLHQLNTLIDQKDDQLQQMSKQIQQLIANQTELAKDAKPGTLDCLNLAHLKKSNKVDPPVPPKTTLPPEIPENSEVTETPEIEPDSLSEFSEEDGDDPKLDNPSKEEGLVE